MLQQSDQEYDDQSGSHLMQTELEKHQINLFPFNLIGAIACDLNTNSNSKVTGTGWLIGSDLVCTVAHNIWDIKNKRTYQKIKFLYGLHDESHQQIQVVTAKVPHKYTLIQPQNKGKSSVAHDYALLKLKTKITVKKYLCLTYDFYNFQEELTLYGYPQLKFTNNKQLIGKMEGYTGQSSKSIFKIQPEYNVLNHLLPSKSGQSGSPVLYKKNGQYCVNSMHKAGVKRKSNQGIVYGASRLITKDLLNKLYEWSKQLNTQISCPIINHREQASYRLSKKIRSLSLFQGRQFNPQNYLIPTNIGITNCTYKNIPQTTIIGTGCAISQNLILTSSSVIYNPIYNNQKDFKTFQDFKNSLKITFTISQKQYQVQDFKISPDILSMKNYSKTNLLTALIFDICLLKLKQPLPLHRYPLIAANSKDQIKEYNLFGYNGQFKQLKSIKIPNYAMNRIQNDNIMIYKIPSNQGMAGSPIYSNQNIVGVHRCKIANSDIRCGRLITIQLLDRMFEWQQQLSGSKFNSIFKQQQINTHDHLTNLHYTIKSNFDLESTK